MVKLRVDMRAYSIRFQFFNREYHAIIKIVECESVRIAQKWSKCKSDMFFKRKEFLFNLANDWTK